MSAFDLICTISDIITNATPTFSRTLASTGAYRLVLRSGANDWAQVELWNGGPLMFLPVAYRVGREWRLDFTASSCKVQELIGLLDKFGLEVKG